MARFPRMITAGQPQYVIVRGNNRSEIFCCAADYLRDTQRKRESFLCADRR